MIKLKESLFKRRKIYKGKSVDFSADIVLLPNGKKSVREYAEHPSAVAVLAFPGKNTIKFKNTRDLIESKILIVRQHRFPVGKITNEIPAGKLDRKTSESLEKCVRRELEEETGYYPRIVKKLISYWPTPAFSTEALHIFTAAGLTKTNKQPDEDEFLESIEVTFGEVLGWIKKGGIKDSKTIIGLLYLYYLVS